MRFRNNLASRKVLKARLRERALKGVAARAAKRLAKLPEPELVKIPCGEHLGVLSWHAADGTVRRWTIRQGDRANNIQVVTTAKTIRCGWDHLMSGLRKHLAAPKRRMTSACLPE